MVNTCSRKHPVLQWQKLEKAAEKQGGGVCLRNMLTNAYEFPPKPKIHESLISQKHVHYLTTFLQQLQVSRFHPGSIYNQALTSWPFTMQNQLHDRNQALNILVLVSTSAHISICRIGKRNWQIVNNRGLDCHCDDLSPGNWSPSCFLTGMSAPATRFSHWDPITNES